MVGELYELCPDALFTEIGGGVLDRPRHRLLRPKPRCDHRARSWRGCAVTAGLRVIECIFRKRPDLQIYEVVPATDGQLLLDLIDRFEVGSDMQPAGGAYGGLIPAYYRYGPLDEHFLGKETVGLGAKTAVLGCECGEVGCWTLMARISRPGTWSFGTASNRYTAQPATTPGSDPSCSAAQYDQALDALLGASDLEQQD